MRVAENSWLMDRNAPIRHKLMAITMMATGVALLFSSAGIVIHNRVQERGELVERMSTTARIVGDNMTAALSFDDAAAAHETLRSLVPLGEISLAAVYDRAGRIFAVYRRDAGKNETVPSSPETPGHRFHSGTLSLFRDIILAGERVGSLHLRVSLERLDRRVRRELAWAFAATLAALVLAWGLAIRLTQVVSGSLVHLAHVIKTVAADRNYEVRVVKASNDELGRLMDGFNHMLAQIQAHIAALSAARDDLEQRVQERTEALEREVTHRRRAEAELVHAKREAAITARDAGTAKNAAAALLEVNGAVGSATVSADLIADSLSNSRAARVAQIARLLQEHEADLGAFMGQDPRGRQVPHQLAQLAEQLRLECDDTARELQLLRRHLARLGEIVARHQEPTPRG